jgi:hypothetical protein
MPDPFSIVAGLNALKTALDSVRQGVAVFKDMRSMGGDTAKQEKIIDSAVTIASTNTAIAEANLGQALGYQLCRCQFPPTPMLTVGYFENELGPGRNTGDPVYECAQCGYTNAGSIAYKRIAPEQAPQKK